METVKYNNWDIEIVPPGEKDWRGEIDMKDTRVFINMNGFHLFKKTLTQFLSSTTGFQYVGHELSLSDIATIGKMINQQGERNGN